MDSLDRVTLQIGDKQFNTIVGTLTHRSDYFKTFFSGKFVIKKQDDGSIFIDANPVLFEHILDYLRRGVFPLAFDKAKGHDYALYAKLLEEAKYFQCPDLIIWLENSCYEKCVSWSITREIDDRLEYYQRTTASTDLAGPISASTELNMIYLCPRRIDIHRGAEWKCGRQCQKAMGEDGPEYDTRQETTTWLMIRKEIVFDNSWMTDSGHSFVSYLNEKKAA